MGLSRETKLGGKYDYKQMGGQRCNQRCACTDATVVLFTEQWIQICTEPKPNLPPKVLNLSSCLSAKADG